MGPAFLLQLFAGIATLHLAFTPVLSPPPEQEILSALSLSAETPTSTPTPTPEHLTYTTKAGDTLATIARAEYGSQKYWVYLWNDNEELKDPSVIHAGTDLKIRTSSPDEVEELSRDLPSPTPTAVPTSAPEPTVAIAQAAPPSQAQAQSVGAPGSFSQAYIDAGSKFGIPWQILYAVHKVETGLRDGPIGPGGGPQGPMQFMPGTWAVHGVDGNGDGVADINNAVDAIHSAANYLSKYGSIEQGLDSYGRIKEDVLNIAKGLGYNG